MTPEQAIMIEAFRRLIEDAESNPIEGYTYPATVDETNIDEVCDGFDEATHGDENGWLREACNEIRTSGTKTGIPSRDWSRHYEQHEVGALLADRWVGWTYWYGGGKHGEPEAIDWMSEAYFLDVTEEERTVVVRTFVSQETGKAGKPVPML
jgi:hypothetical protein